MRMCNQVGCRQPAAFRFTWPGHVERTICASHRKRAEKVTEAMGFQVQFIPLEEPTLSEVQLEDEPEEGDRT